MRPHPSRLKREAYPFTAEIPARFGDVDVLAHLNNVAVAQIYEEGRVQLHRSLGLRPRRGDGTLYVIGQVLINYLGEGGYPGTLQVAGGIARIGGASYTIAQGLFQEGRCIGTADSIIVCSKDGRSHPLHDEVREALKALEMSTEGGVDG